METTLTVRADAPIGTISPRLYGHFAEHLGRCCYDGLWIGNQNTSIPHTNGFRSDVLAALKALPVPMLRWPGGCYADHYHWRDGIGPAEERAIRLGMSCGLQVEDDNTLGTHEFLWLCEQLGAEPYLAGNVGTGTPQELCDRNSQMFRDLARGHRTAPFIRPVAALTKPSRAPMTRHEGGYYIRLEVVDKPGTAARIASRMAQNNISLESIVQRRAGPVRGGTDPAAAAAPAPVVLITYATTEAAVRRALKAMDSDGILLGAPQVIRIERN